MSINFKAENGLCPYFIYNDKKFYIQEYKDDMGNYKFKLCMQIIKEENVILSDSDEVKEFLRKKKECFKI